MNATASFLSSATAINLLANAVESSLPPLEDPWSKKSTSTAVSFSNNVYPLTKSSNPQSSAPVSVIVPIPA